MDNEIDVLGRSVMQLTLDDAISLANLMSEGSGRLTGFSIVRERFPNVVFATAPDTTSMYVIGHEKDVNMVRDSIYNARKFAMQLPG